MTKDVIAIVAETGPGRGVNDIVKVQVCAAHMGGIEAEYPPFLQARVGLAKIRKDSLRWVVFHKNFNHKIGHEASFGN